MRRLTALVVLCPDQGFANTQIEVLLNWIDYVPMWLQWLYVDEPSPTDGVDLWPLGHWGSGVDS